MRETDERRNLVKRGLVMMLAAVAAAAAGLELHVVHLQPSGGEVAVREMFLFRNGQAGTLRFFVPEAAEANFRVTTQSPEGKAVEQRARPAGRKGEYTLDLALGPGETRVDVSYAVPLAEDGAFSGKAFHPGLPLRLVVPSGLALEGEGLEALGQDPGRQVTIYGFQGGEYTIRIREAEEAEESGAVIQPILPRVYDQLPWILVPAGLVLLLGFLLNYLRGAAAPGGGERRR